MKKFYIVTEDNYNLGYDFSRKLTELEFYKENNDILPVFPNIINLVQDTGNKYYLSELVDDENNNTEVYIILLFENPELQSEIINQLSKILSDKIRMYLVNPTKKLGYLWGVIWNNRLVPISYRQKDTFGYNLLGVYEESDFVELTGE